MARLVPILFVTVACATLGACGELPRPFKPTVEATNPLLAPPHPAVIEVPPVENLPPPASAGLRVALADELRKRDVPAVAEPRDTRNPQLRGRINLLASSAGQDRMEIVWRVFELGRDTGLGFVHERVTPAGALAEGDDETLRDVAASSAGHLAALLTGRDPMTPIPAIVRPDSPQYAKRSAATPVSAPNAVSAPPPTAEGAVAAKPDRRPEQVAAAAPRGPTRVVILPIASAPGDSATSLRRALAGHLRAAGVLVVDANAAKGDALAVRGTVDLSEPTGGQQQVDLLWRLEKSDGAEIGQVSQSNMVAEGSLDGPWGPIAAIAALGAAEGLVALIRETEPR